MIQNIVSECGKVTLTFSDRFGVFSLSPVKLEYYHSLKGSEITNAVTGDGCPYVIFTGTAGQSSLSNKSLCVFNCEENRKLSEIELSDVVKKIVIVEPYFYVVLNTEVFVYRIDPPELVKRYFTGENEYAPFDFYKNNDELILAFTGNKNGTIRIIRGDENEVTINAATHKITMLKFSESGEIIATASANGTLIRLFNTNDGCMIKEFRRGSFSANIYSIQFSIHDELVGVISSNGTLHLFDINSESNKSIIKWRLENKGFSVFQFLSKDELVVIMNNGKIVNLKINESKTSLSVISCSSVFDFLQK